MMIRKNLDLYNNNNKTIYVGRKYEIGNINTEKKQTNIFKLNLFSVCTYTTL